MGDDTARVRCVGLVVVSATARCRDEPCCDDPSPNTGINPSGWRRSSP